MSTPNAEYVRQQRQMRAHLSLLGSEGHEPTFAEGCPLCEPERVRVYDEHGEPHDEVLRTKSGRVLTDEDIWKLAEDAAQIDRSGADDE